MKIGYIPFHSQNDYVTNMKRILSEKGEVCHVPMDIKQLTRARFDLVLVNWREAHFISPQTGRLNYLTIAVEFIRVFYLKWISKKVVCVIHNKYPHHTDRKSIPAIKRIQNYYWYLFDDLFCHSGVESVRYVPHPAYQVQQKIERTESLLPNVGDYYLTFGRVERYKKIEKVIDSLPADKTLVVCGKANDPEYQALLSERARGKSVWFIDYYVEHQDLVNLIAHAYGIILPADGEDMIVSGSFHFAMSCGATIYSLPSDYLTWYLEHHKPSNLYLVNSIQEVWDQKPLPKRQGMLAEYQAEHSDESVLRYLKV